MQTRSQAANPIPLILKPVLKPVLKPATVVPKPTINLSTFTNPASHVVIHETPTFNLATMNLKHDSLKHDSLKHDSLKHENRKQKNEWASGLLPTCHNCHNCAYATVCPCIWTYHTAAAVLKDHAAASAMDDSGCNTCYAGALSVMICAPSIFCIDRSVTKGLNDYADNHEAREEEPSFAEGMYNFVTGAGFGTSGQNATWLNDGDGYDLLHRDETTASEDYWAADWCRYYIYNAFCCNLMRCRMCNQSSVYTPMCFVLMCGAVYPVCLCPSTLLLRRIVVSSRNIHESCLESSIFSAFCTPCAMVQTLDEMQNNTTSAPNTMT
jgi:hypothetical protein